jgi:hypothetical protein
MRCLAFDSGPWETSFAVVDYAAGAEILIDIGTVSSTRNDLENIIRHSYVGLDVIGVEVSRKIWTKTGTRENEIAMSKARGNNLLLTAETAGMLIGLSALPTITLPANAPHGAESWRRLLTGAARAGDAEVFAAIRHRLHDVSWAGLSVHHRDAIGLACVVLDLHRRQQLVRASQ